MKIGGISPGFSISAKGLSIQRKKMNLIAENIANADSVRDANGNPYQRKFLVVKDQQTPFTQLADTNIPLLPMETSNSQHLAGFDRTDNNLSGIANEEVSKELTDKTKGDVVYMPDHPNADSNGYVEMSNVNIITEMTDMIAATRSYEANLTALNSSKQIVKDSLDI